MLEMVLKNGTCWLKVGIGEAALAIGLSAAIVMAQSGQAPGLPHNSDTVAGSTTVVGLSGSAASDAAVLGESVEIQKSMPQANAALVNEGAHASVGSGAADGATLSASATAEVQPGTLPSTRDPGADGSLIKDSVYSVIRGADGKVKEQGDAS